MHDANWLGPIRWTARSLFLAATLGPTLSGCKRDDGRLECYPTTGRVLLGDKPAEGVMVRFYDAANPANVDAPQPYATTDASGHYSMSTYEPGDGAPAGDYIVVLFWASGPPGPGIPGDRMGNAYTNPSTTPFKAKVSRAESKIEPFKIDPSVMKKGSSRPAATPEGPAPAIGGR